MSKIISIATSVPGNKFSQEELFDFANKVQGQPGDDSRKLKYLYSHSGIDYRYSVIPDYKIDASQRVLFPPSDDLEPFPGVEKRMEVFTTEAVKISVDAITKCIDGKIKPSEITHLVTVSCTGVSAPGLDLQIMETLALPQDIIRTSVNFMGCYAAVHGLKLADVFCRASPGAKVMVVCTELCTLHFQKTNSVDNITASLLFGDGSAAMLVTNTDEKAKGLLLEHFFSDVSFKGKNEMAWMVSASGFLMTLTGYVPQLIKEDFKALVEKAMRSSGRNLEEISHWCIHPGGKQILNSISAAISLDPGALRHSFDVLRDFGNMSSASIVFVLQRILEDLRQEGKVKNLIFGAAFGPGLTMETFTARYV